MLPCTSTCRELQEEAGITAKSLSEVGILMFEFVGDPQLLEVHVFTGTEYEGTPTESDGKHSNSSTFSQNM